MKSIQALWLSVACALVMLSTPVVIGQDADSVKSTPVPLKATYPDLVPSPIQAVAGGYVPIASNPGGRQIFPSPAAAASHTELYELAVHPASEFQGNVLQIKLKLAKYSFDPERIGVDWDWDLIDSESAVIVSDFNAQRITVGKLDPSRLDGSVLDKLVERKFANLLTMPIIAVLSGQTATMQVNYPLVRSDKEVETAEGLSKTHAYAGISLSFSPKLIENSVQLVTRIEEKYIAPDESYSLQLRSSIVEFPFRYELGKSYAIRTEPMDTNQFKSGNNYYMILKIDRIEPVSTAVQSIPFVAPSIPSQTVAVPAMALDSARQSSSVDANRLSANPSLSAVPPKIDSDSSKVSLSAIQDEVSLLRKDVARLIQLLESRK